MILLSRRAAAGDQLLFIQFLFLLFLIGGGLLLGTFLFFGDELDVRWSEALALASLLEDCLQTHDPDLRKAADVYRLCGLHQGSIERNFLVKVERTKLISNVPFTETFTSGSGFANCDFLGAQDNIYYPRCVNVDFSEGVGSQKVDYNILVGSSHWHTRRALG